MNVKVGNINGLDIVFTLDGTDNLWMQIQDPNSGGRVVGGEGWGEIPHELPRKYKGDIANLFDDILLKGTAALVQYFGIETADPTGWRAMLRNFLENDIKLVTSERAIKRNG